MPRNCLGNRRRPQPRSCLNSRHRPKHAAARGNHFPNEEILNHRVTRMRPGRCHDTSSLVMSLPEHLARPLDVLMIDNFDSFTWNLYQHLVLLGADVHVIRNDAIDTDALPLLQIRALIISPGPGHPNTDSGVSRDAIRYFTGR